MILEQRSYSGQSFRPRPLVSQNNEGLIVLTPWGAPEYAETTLKTIQEFLEISREAEATVVGNVFENLTPIANRLRSAAVMANENLYLNANKSEYVSAVEMLAIYKEKNTLNWVHVGSPHLFLMNEQGIQPLCYTLDWSWQVHQGSPLLCHGLGVERSCQLNCGSYRMTDPSTKLIMIGRSYVPTSFYSLKNASLQSITDVLVEDSADVPFWLGIVSL